MFTPGYTLLSQFDSSLAPCIVFSPSVNIYVHIFINKMLSCKLALFAVLFSFTSLVSW